jgi:hypothetical protein
MTHRPHRDHPPPTTELGPRNSWVSVYSGQTCIGFLLSRGCTGVEAFDASDRSLGLFPTQAEAAAALKAVPR